mmetsp:Transcript_28993/g.73581  ORF Transcript_28993/g.73581 Transcript_28993/m.73581 type:complete len:513 (+) Transcript_28993:1024-2562(+)
MSECSDSLSRVFFSRVSREILKEANVRSKTWKSGAGKACSRCRASAETLCTFAASCSSALRLRTTPSSSCARSAESSDSSWSAMPAQRSRSSAPDAAAPDAAAPPPMETPADGDAAPAPWMCSSSSAARARVSSPCTVRPLSPTSPARLPAMRPSFAAGGLAAQSRLRISGARSGSSSRPASRVSVEFAPQSVLVKFGSFTASGEGRPRTERISCRASLRCSGSVSKSPLATRPAMSTAPSSWHVAILDFSRTLSICRPWPPGCMKVARTGGSHASHSSFATNSWQRSRCVRTASCERPPHRRNDARRSAKRSASRATMTFRAVRASSNAPSSLSTRPRSIEMTSATSSLVLAASSAPRAPASSWQIAVRPPRLQWLPSGSPPLSSRRPSTSTAVTVGWPNRYTSSLYFGWLSLARVRIVLPLPSHRDLGIIVKRAAMMAGSPRFKNFHRWRFFSMSTSWLASMARKIFSSSTLREATTAASVPSTPFGGMAGRCRPGQSVTRDLYSASKSP